MDVSDAFQRTELLVGSAGIAQLRKARILVFGVGGVGSYAVEALCRAGIGTFTLVDFDVVKPSNTNRQIHAMTCTLDRPKIDVMAERMISINPEVIVERIPIRLGPDGPGELLLRGCDYVVDAIDQADAKLALLAECVRNKIPVVSSMGAANKLLTDRVRVCDISETRQCPLARSVRKQLRRQGISEGITVVYSEELPIQLPDIGAFQADAPEDEGEKRPQGTISYMPALFGLHCAGVVIRYLLRDLPFQRRGETPRKADAGKSC